MTITSALIFALLAGTPAAEASKPADPAADISKVRELIKQLADPKFKVRDSAEKELIQLGLASLDSLKEGEKSPDLHVQERCRQLQPMIRALTLQKRIDVFLKNRDATLPKNLPFVASFMKITGDSKESRELYADLLVLHAQLLDEAERDRKKGMDMFVAYCQEINNRMRYVPGIDQQSRYRSITKADVILFFLMSQELAADRTGRISNFGYTFFNTPVLAEMLGKDTPATVPFKKMFLSWIDKEPQPYMVQRGLQIAADAKMKEALPLVLKHIKDKNAQVYTRAQTALLLAKIGTKESIKEIEPILEDKTLIGNFNINNTQGKVEMRDVALAICVKLSGQKMSEYDFDVMKGNDEVLYMSYIYCAFSSEAKREAAHKKYKDTKAKDLKEKDAKK